MPPHKLKDPFHKFKATLSKYLNHSSSSKPTPSIESSLFGLGKRSGAPSTSGNTSQSFFGRSSSQKMFPQELAPELALFNKFFAHLHMQCRSCHAPLSFEIDEHLATWLTGTQVIPPTSQLSVLQCTKCDISTCLGCGGEPNVNNHSIFTSLGVVNHCCHEGRLFGIWLLLARFDKAESPSDRETIAAIPRRATVKKSKSKKSSVPTQSGVGYSAGSTGYYDAEDMLDLDMDMDLEALEGFSGGVPLPLYYEQYIAPTHIARDQKSRAREEKMKSQDKLLADTLKLLMAFFPSSDSPPHPLEEIRLYRLSFLIDRIAELLRNDSIIDITLRKELYTQLFAFVQAVANVPELVELLLEERPDKSHGPGIHSLLKSTQRPLEGTKDVPGTLLPSVFTGSLDTYRQAKSFLAISKMPQGALCQGLAPAPIARIAVPLISEENFDEDDSVKICEQIVEIYEYLQKYEASPSVANDQTDIWTKYAEENRVTFDDDVLRNHRYINEINNLKSSPKGRLTTIGKEVATMTTSLPAGIFVKIAESRSDAMKVLIVGSEGSPYARGLFIFDIFLDAQYPISPPKVAFVLDGNDSEAHSFNPNLHRGGGVCLSLLNTWEGNPNEMWQPNKSTVLAVLISIQAMILGAPVPWVNEPGFATHENTPQAKDHKLLIQTKTVKYAMIGWLENKFNVPGSKEYIWKDISQTYWKHNGKAALNAVKTWANDNPDLIHFGARAPAPKRRKGKSKEVQPEPAPTSGGQDLVEKLAQCLGLAGDNSSSSHKRKASSSGTSSESKKQKSESLEDQSIEMRWYYKGATTQKDVRNACKEFGIGAASTIDACIGKLEKHVNTKGKASEELVEKWGEMREVVVRLV